MKPSRDPRNRATWRRRLRPAAPFVLMAASASLFVVAAMTLPGRSRPEEPAARRPLATPALAAENVIPAPRLASGVEAPPVPPEHSAPARVRRPVDVIDRDAAQPRTISIPAIGVHAPIIPLGLNRDGTMQTPRDFGDTGWYRPGAEPGERGPAVIVGHVDSVSGPAVFYRLGELRRGDVVRIRRADGSAVRFRVEGLERWPKADFPTRRVFGRTRTATLRLVTCGGRFDSSTGHYVDNTIAYAVRMRARGLVRH